MASKVTKTAWVVAASVAAVEALKDQAGLCRWNYVLRSLHQHAKNNLSSSLNQSKNINISPAAAVVNSVDRLRNKMRVEKANKSEESLRTVMYLSCWGPN